MLFSDTDRGYNYLLSYNWTSSVSKEKKEKDHVDIEMIVLEQAIPTN